VLAFLTLSTKTGIPRGWSANGRCPQTGATLKIAARRVAKFTAGAELKKSVNRGK
jgi:nucleoid DNA-binding protein